MAHLHFHAHHADHAAPAGPAGPDATPADQAAADQRLRLVLLLNFAIPAAQIVGGLMANSMALISDATHNFSDFTAVFITYLARLWGRKPASARSTFGHQRLETLAVLANVGLLLVAAGFIVYSAVGRLITPEPVSGWLVMVAAGVGVVGNGYSTWLLKKDAGQSLNLRGAFLHMLADFLTSVCVLISGLLMLYWPIYWLDPLLSVAIALLISKNAWDLLRQAADILLNRTPQNLDLAAVKACLEDEAEVQKAHHLHAWSISEHEIAFSAHLVVADQPLSRVDELARRLQDALAQRFSIEHATLQFETAVCDVASGHCAGWD